MSRSPVGCQGYPPPEQVAAPRIPESREDHLDHDEPGGARLHHEDEADVQPDGDEGMYDLFMGKADGNTQGAGDTEDQLQEDDECRRLAKDVGRVTQEILHVAAGMGIRHQYYARQLRDKMKEFNEWRHARDDVHQ